MKKHILLSAIAGLLILSSISAFAKPAKKGLMDVETADGSLLQVHLVGDEFYHQYFTEDGYPLVESDGNFYYCDFNADGSVIDSKIKATSVQNRSKQAIDFISKIDKSSLNARIKLRESKSPRRLSINKSELVTCKKVTRAEGNDGPPYEMGYGLFPSSKFPAYGNQKAIVILVEYTDVKFDTSYDAKDYFTRMLNEDNFCDPVYGGTGSCAQFFKENSKGAFIPEFDLYGPITLAHERAYYGKNDIWGDDMRPHEMVVEACDQLDDIVDFREYDRDGDGVIDNIYVFYAGRGEATGGGTNSVWPHSWSVIAGGVRNKYYDGVLLDTYGCSNEWEGNGVSGRPDGIGTFVHEFSHVMGLPDLYATDYATAFTPGEWSALDYGPYNNGGKTPPNYGAFERYALGWIKPREILGPISATLPSIDSNECGIIRTPKETEFFLLENRQQEGWDKYIPYHGMLIWHIDYNASIWQNNTVNNTASHQYVDIEEADNQMTEQTRRGDSFPGNKLKTSFTADTTPAMVTWDGTAIDYPITEIAENDGLITFNVLGGSDTVLTPIDSEEATEISDKSFTFGWELPDIGNDIVVNVYYRRESVPGRVEPDIYVEGYRHLLVRGQDTLTVTGLLPETTYYYTVAQTNGWEISEFSKERSVTTLPEDLSSISCIETEYNGINIFGNMIECTDGSEIIVADLAGRIIIRGAGRVIIPSDGFYIISIPSKVFVKKFIVKI